MFMDDEQDTADETPGPRVPTLAELKARWAWNRDWDEACFQTAMEEMD